MVINNTTQELGIFPRNDVTHLYEADFHPKILHHSFEHSCGDKIVESLIATELICFDCELRR